MSYIVKKRRYRGARRLGLGSIIDDIEDMIWSSQPNAGKTTLYGNPPGGGGTANPCLAEANAQSKPLRDKTSDLAVNWRPSGFYSPVQVQQLVAATLDVLQRGADSLSQVKADETLGDSAALGSFMSRISAKVADATAYSNAARSAQSSLAAVNAPGLKDWVIKSMVDAAAGMDAAYVVACQRPWWAGVFRAFAAAFSALYSLAKGIVGVAVDVGTAVVKVASSLPTIATVLVWGGLAVGAVYLYTQLRRGGRPEYVTL